MSTPTSGQAPFVFAHRPDLRAVPPAAREFEVNLHGGFAVDKRPGRGQVFYGMPGCGLVRVSADLSRQEIVSLPADLTPVNFHSTKIGQFDGQTRLFLAADNDAMVAVVTLEGDIDFVLPKPVFEQYQAEEAAFRPTDTALVDDRLFVADGYGANYISVASVRRRQWTGLFGGKGESHTHDGFGTAHGLNVTPSGAHLAIADRPHSRLELYTLEGRFDRSYALSAGSRPCGIDYVQRDGRWYAVVGSLDDPQPGRPAPIYILDAESYQVLSTIRPKEELGLERVDHLHNVVWREHNGRLFLVCQAWNPGFYFVLEQVS